MEPMGRTASTGTTGSMGGSVGPGAGPGHGVSDDGPDREAPDPVVVSGHDPSRGPAGDGEPVEVVDLDRRPGFDDWYVSRFAGLVRLARLMVGSEDVAVDLVQDALVGVLRHWHRIERPDHYARRAVTNACRSHHRRLATVRRNPTRPVEPVELGARELDDVLSRLTQRQRAAVVLRYWGNLSEADIADILGVRRGSVASLLHRAIAELREVVEP